MATPINFLTGRVDKLNTLPLKQGQVIFALNSEDTICDIYYDVSSSSRINVTNSSAIGSLEQDIASTYLKGFSVENFSIKPIFGDGAEGTEQLIAFTGTMEAYEAAFEHGLIKEGMIVHITDDEDVAVEPTIAVDKLPAANANHRGCILLLEQNNTDTPYMCLKKSGAYAWYEIKTGTNGIQGEGDLPLPPAESGATTAKLGVAVLGTMVLGQE